MEACHPKTSTSQTADLALVGVVCAFCGVCVRGRRRLRPRRSADGRRSLRPQRDTEVHRLKNLEDEAFHPKPRPARLPISSWSVSSVRSVASVILPISSLSVSSVCFCGVACARAPPVRPRRNEGKLSSMREATYGHRRSQTHESTRARISIVHVCVVSVFCGGWCAGVRQSVSSTRSVAPAQWRCSGDVAHWASI